MHPDRRFAQHTWLDREPVGPANRTPQHAGLLEPGVSGIFPVRVSRNEAKGNGPRSEYSSNFRWWLLYLPVRRLTCDFTAHWFASFANADQRLAELTR